MKKLKRFLSGFLVLMLCLTLLPTFPVKAAGTNVDLVGDSSPANTGTLKDGVSYLRTGYLCYLLTADGQAVPGTSAYAFKCPNFAGLSNSVFYASARKGGYYADSWAGTAPWNCSPFNGDKTTNADVIRNWMKTISPSGFSQGQQFVKSCWGASCADKWATGEYIMIVETILSFRYTFYYTYDASLSVSNWKAYYDALYGSSSVPDSTRTAQAQMRYTEAQSGVKFKAPFGPAVIGTLRDCLDYRDAVYTYACNIKPYCNIQNGNLLSPYTNKVACYAERIGAGSAGERAGFVAYTGDITVNLSDAQVYQYGVGMLAISALEDDIVPPPPGGPAPSSYDGTVYTLTSSGGSSSTGGGSNGGQFSGGGAGSTTHLGNGYNADSCAIGELYAENCASGDAAYALADSMKSGMSYEGSIPPVVFSGTSFDVNVDNSMGVIAGMLTVDPSTFPGVTISSSSASDYSSYLSTIMGSLSPDIDMYYKGNTLAGTYSGSSLESTPVIGGDSVTNNYTIYRTCTLTYSNCRPGGVAPTWDVSGDYDALCLRFGKIFLNNSNASAQQGRDILENTDLFRAFWLSSNNYVANLKSGGTLEQYWTDKLNAYKDSVGNSAGNSAVASWLVNNPEPLLSNYPSQAAWELAHDSWAHDKSTTFNTAYNTAVAGVNDQAFTCTYQTPNGWKFNLYSCSPIMQRLYSVHDKLPIDDGPSRGGELFDEAWRVSFNLDINNTASLGSDVTNRLLVYMPLAGVQNTTVGNVVDISKYVDGEHVRYTDFLLPDATSMDMR